MEPELNAIVLWRSLFYPGMEICSLEGTPGGFRLEGTALAALEGQPARVFYRVRCDRQWRTRAVRLSLWHGSVQAALDLRADGEGGWWAGENELQALRGCLDVDLGISPATNTLPVRRLNLAIGEGAEILAAWVRFPGLEIRPLAQRYTRLAELRYRYESDNFAAEIEVDRQGLVVQYEGGWERVKM